MLTVILVLLVLWVLGVFDNDSYDCCAGNVELSRRVIQLEYELNDLYHRIYTLEEQNGLQDPDERK